MNDLPVQAVHGEPAIPSVAPAIEAHGLTVRLGSGRGARTIVQGVDLYVPDGAVVGLIGRNGAGKTTLLDALVGRVAPHAGHSQLLGCPSLDLTDPVRERLGYVAQSPDLFPGLSGLQHLQRIGRLYANWHEARARMLADKLGLPMAAVHAPVAGYAEQLAGPVDRFFERLEVDAPRWRLNWNLTDDDSLYQPGGKYRTEPAEGLGPDDVADAVWLRVERQTLRRLPGTGAVVFGIRVHQDPLGLLAGRHDVLERLSATIRSFPPGTLEHKSMGAFAPAVLAWIDDRLRNGRAGGSFPGSSA